MNRDLYHNVSMAQSIKPQELNSTTDGAEADVQGYESCTIELSVGTLGGTTPSFTFIIEESDTSGGGFTTVGDSDILGASGETATIVIDDAAEDDQIYERGYIGGKRYLRVAASAVTGTSPSLLT